MVIVRARRAWCDGRGGVPSITRLTGGVGCTGSVCCRSDAVGHAGPPQDAKDRRPLRTVAGPMA